MRWGSRYGMTLGGLQGRRRASPTADSSGAAGVWRSGAPGEPSAREIHAIPKEVHRAGLVMEAGPKLTQRQVGDEKLVPEHCGALPYLVLTMLGVGTAAISSLHNMTMSIDGDVSKAR